MNVDMKMSNYISLVCLLALLTSTVYTQDKGVAQREKALLDFILYDQVGDAVNLKQKSGKVLVIDFWYTGCSACSYYYQNTLAEVESKFYDRGGIAFITIAADKELGKWQKSIEQGIYTSPHSLNLFTGESRFKHPLLEYYGINRFPSMLVVDQHGMVFRLYRGNDKPNSTELTVLLEDLL